MPPIDGGVTVRPATTADVPDIERIVQPYVERRILLGKERVTLYESIQEFLVAEDASGNVVGCGALHVFWEDLAEVRTLALGPETIGRGVGRAILARLIERARRLGIERVFCLTFEVDFFERNGFRVLRDPGVDPDVYAQLVRSPDDGVAEFLDLARVKQNTLGNTRMIRHLSDG